MKDFQEINRVDLTPEGQHRLPRVADHRALRERAERIQRVNRRHAQLHRMRGLLSTRLHREPHHGIDVDTVKVPGRRYGPTPLRLILPRDPAPHYGVSAETRRMAYQIQRVAMQRTPMARVSAGMDFVPTPRQARRMRKKKNQRLARSGAL